MVHLVFQIGFKQCFGGATALQHAPIQPDHLVAHFQRAQPMRGDDANSLALACQHGLLDGGLAGLIQSARGLVEDEDLRSRIERAGDGDALQLTAREAVAALAHRMVDIRAFRSKKIDGRFPAGPAYFFLIRFLAPVAEGHVLGHCSGEQVGILRDIADVLPIRGQFRGAHGFAVDQEPPGGRLQEAAQDIDEGALARPGTPHQAHGAAVGDGAADVRERIPVRAGIAVGDMVKDDISADAEARRGRHGQHGVGGAQSLKIVQARQGRGLQAAQRHCGAHHAVQGRQHAPRREREQRHRGGDGGQSGILDKNEQEHGQPDEEKTAAFQCPGGDRGAEAQKRPGSHACAYLIADGLEEDRLLLVDDEFAHAAERGHAGCGLLLLRPGRPGRGAVDAPAQDLVGQQGHSQHEGHRAQRDAGSVNDEAQKKQADRDEVATGRQDLQQHLAEVETPRHGRHGAAALGRKVPVIGHVQEARHDIQAHMGGHPFGQHGGAPGHQRGERVLEHDQADGYQTGAEHEEARVREDGPQRRAQLQERARGAGVDEAFRHVQHCEESRQGHDARQFDDPQKSHAQEQADDAPLQHRRQHGVNAFQVAEKQLQPRHWFQPAPDAAPARLPRPPSHPAPPIWP